MITAVQLVHAAVAAVGGGFAAVLLPLAQVSQPLNVRIIVTNSSATHATTALVVAKQGGEDAVHDVHAQGAVEDVVLRGLEGLGHLGLHRLPELGHDVGGLLAPVQQERPVQVPFGRSASCSTQGSRKSAGETGNDCEPRCAGFPVPGYH